MSRFCLLLVNILGKSLMDFWTDACLELCHYFSQAINQMFFFTRHCLCHKDLLDLTRVAPDQKYLNEPEPCLMHNLDILSRGWVSHYKHDWFVEQWSDLDTQYNSKISQNFLWINIGCTPFSVCLPFQLNINTNRLFLPCQLFSTPYSKTWSKGNFSKL